MKTTHPRRASGLTSSAAFAAALLTSFPVCAETLSIEQAIRRLCQSSPDRALADAETNKASATAAATGYWPNPQLVGNHGQLFNGPEETETTVGVNVPLVISGQYALQEDAAERRAVAQAYRSQGALVDAANLLQLRAADASYAHSKATLMQRHATELTRLGQTVDKLVLAGERSELDAVRHQAKASLATSLALQQKATSTHAQQLLTSWLGVDVELPALEREIAVNEANANAMTPTQRALQADAEAAGIAAEAADRQWVPIPQLMVGYRTLDAGGSRGHGIALGLTLPITLFNHGQGTAGAARAAQLTSHAALARDQNETRSTAESAAVLAEGLRVASDAAQIALDQATSARRKAEQLYAAGEATTSELHDAYDAELDAELAKLELLAQQHRAALAQQRARGTLGNAELDRLCSPKRSQ